MKNAVSVHVKLSNGILRNLGVTILVSSYLNLSGVKFISPLNHGMYSAIPAGALGPHIGNIHCIFQYTKVQFMAYTNVIKEILALIIGPIP